MALFSLTLSKIQKSTVSNGSLAPGNSIGIGAALVDPSSLPSDGVSGAQSEILATLKGILMVYSPYLIEGEDETNHVMKCEEQFEYTHITGSAATTVVKASAGYLKGITLNTISSGSITIYNQTSAAEPSIAVISGSTVPTTLSYNCKMSNGITIVTTAGEYDITVLSR